MSQGKERTCNDDDLGFSHVAGMLLKIDNEVYAVFSIDARTAQQRTNNNRTLLVYSNAPLPGVGWGGGKGKQKERWQETQTAPWQQQ
jgi:hypothetical protein